MSSTPDAATDAVRRLSSMVREHGWLGSLRRVLHSASERLSDGRYGIKSRKPMSTQFLGVSDPLAHGYDPIPYSICKRMLKALKARRDDELLDVGCGVGRPIAVAARMPFRRLFGVEVSSTLSEMASASFARYAGRVAIFNADVRDFEIPDTVSCIYMSNPFHGEPMDATVSAIKRSQGRQPRIIRIVVFNEGHFERSAEGCGWIQRVERRSVGFPVKGSWALYHASPAEPAG